MRILVTAGATQEPIDSVRYISNISTGRTGASLSEEFCSKGAHVVHLAGLQAWTPSPHDRLKLMRFSSFQDLKEQLSALLSQTPFDAVIHSAAVSDYSVEDPQTGKLSSDPEEMTLKLKRNPKLIHQIKDFSRHPLVQVIAFKLTHTPNPVLRMNAIERLSLRSDIHLVVHNDLSEIQSLEHHPFHIYQGNQRLQTVTNSRDLAQFLFQQLSQRMDSITQDTQTSFNHGRS